MRRMALRILSRVRLPWAGRVKPQADGFSAVTGHPLEMVLPLYFSVKNIHQVAVFLRALDKGMLPGAQCRCRGAQKDLAPLTSISLDFPATPTRARSKA